MRQRSILLLGCLVSSGTIALVSPAIAQPPVPVVRANGFTQQVPSCYIETTNSGFQNLDAACLMGKVPETKMLDMVTDRDGDGVPDDIASVLKRMSDIGRGAAADQAGQLKALLRELGQRAPVSPQTRRNLNELVEASAILGQIGFGERNNSPAQEKQYMQRLERFSQLSMELSKDPFMKKMNEYDRLYRQNRAKTR